MKGVRLILIPLVLLWTIAVRSQERKRYVDHGLLRAQGNIALGTPTGYSGTNIYFAGDLGYYLTENISVRGDTYVFLNSFDGDRVFKNNHSVFLGLLYHIPTNSNFDPYVGIQPAFTFSQLKTNNSLQLREQHLSQYPLTLNPLLSFNFGFNYYANRFFNLFAHVKYQTGKHHSDIEPVSLNEIKIAFGLGYMFWVRKDHFGFGKPGNKKGNE